MTPEDRFWAKVETRGPTECWPWIGATASSGYGSFWLNGAAISASRAALILVTNDNPADKLACHHCDNPLCCNPAHLYWGTFTDNAYDSSLRGHHRNTAKTHCPKGHEYTTENTWFDRGWRRCLACLRQRDK